MWNDGSTDSSASIVEALRMRLEKAGVNFVVGGGPSEGPTSCGTSKNRAVRQSSGEWLCFQDADDFMRPDRVKAQLALATIKGPGCLVGCNVRREPEGSQPRHTAWLNGLTDDQLMLQRFCESTVCMPTWFCSRSMFEKIGGFSEAGRGTPEDLRFFYEHIDAGGTLAKVREELVVYRFHADMESRGVPAVSIWDRRVVALQSSLLDDLECFSIWSAGRDGKRLYRSLSMGNRSKVVAFLDIDPGKLKAGLYFDRDRKVHIPIICWKNAAKKEYQPSIICVKRGLHSGFEENLGSLDLQEGRHYWHFN